MIPFLLTIIIASPLQPVLQRWAIDAELMDPHEVPYLLTKPEDALADCCTLYKRWQDLADAPHLVDCARLPSLDVAMAMIDFNLTYQTNMIARRNFNMTRYWDYEPVLHECIQLYSVWDSLRDAQREYYYVTFRRHALKKLREQIGYGAYYAGMMPPPAPLWAFHEID